MCKCTVMSQISWGGKQTPFYNRVEVLKESPKVKNPKKTISASAESEKPKKDNICKR